MLPVIRETRELLAALHKLNGVLPNVLLGIWGESLPPDKQVEFGDLLIAAGELLQEHARNVRATVVDSDGTTGLAVRDTDLDERD
jgi:hypothetical protein